MSVYFWAVNSRLRASFIARSEQWREILYGLRPFPNKVFDEFPLLLDESTGSDVPDPDVLPLVDFVDLDGYCRLVSNHAREVLGPDLERCGEFFPVALRGIKYWLFRPTTVVDCLDEEMTRANRNGGRLIWIYRPTFLPERVSDDLVFMVPNCTSHVFVGEKFKEMIKRGKLKGAHLYLDQDDRGWKT